MEHRQVLTEAARILTERQGEYGSPEECFARIANIASEILARRVSRYEVAAILFATKMGRAAESGTKMDTWVDAINYASFAAQFSTDPDSPAVRGAAPGGEKVTRPPPVEPRSIRSIEDALREFE